MNYIEHKFENERKATGIVYTLAYNLRNKKVKNQDL